MGANKTEVRIATVLDGVVQSRFDDVASEEPLEIRVVCNGATITAAVTMRTPGNDFELSVGFLFAEGMLRSWSELSAITYCIEREIDVEQRFNIVNVELRNVRAGQLQRLERHFMISSACGVCGKASLEALEMGGGFSIKPGPTIKAETIYDIPQTLKEAQAAFRSTGGLHAAGLFDRDGNLLAVREDVGRHNAVDKLVGWAFLNKLLPLSERLLMVSGRSSFEILQKSLSASIPIVCAVSAPSSLAVALARKFDVTLIGFLRDRRFNIYAGDNRIEPVRVTLGAAARH